MNLIMLFFFAFTVAGTDIYLLGDWVSIDGNEFCDGGYVSYYDGKAKFKFHWAQQQGRDCDGELFWPETAKKILVNTQTMCLETKDHDRDQYHTVVVNGKQQCCDGKPYLGNQQSFEPGTESGVSPAKPDDTANQRVAVIDPPGADSTTPIPPGPNPSSQQLAENFDTTGSGTTGPGGSAADFPDQGPSANDIDTVEETTQDGQPASAANRADDFYRIRRRGAGPSHRLLRS